MNTVIAGLEKAEGAALTAAAMSWSPPMLATLTDRRFSDSAWIYERKFDGERAIAVRDGAEVRLLTRNQKNIAPTYPEIVDALKAQACDAFVVDGEIVAFDGKVTSFARLQRRMQIADRAAARASPVSVFFYLFDITGLSEYSLKDLPLRKRKSLLKSALRYRDPLRFTPHRNRDGEAYFRQACGEGWEGVIAKRAASPYRQGRSTDWLKFKCGQGQEFVIAGFTAPQGSRRGFGALLLGYYDRGKLRYAGRVGTGFDETFLKALRDRLDGLARRSSPFGDEVREAGVTWVSPKLVGEVGFTEWTEHGKLRHPRFLGLRRDKRPEDVVRERPGA